MSDSVASKLTSLRSQLFNAVRFTHIRSWSKSKNLGIAGFIAFAGTFCGLFAWQTSGHSAALSGNAPSASNSVDQPAAPSQKDDTQSSVNPASTPPKSVNVTVNGQNVAVPQSGELHKVVQDSHGTTKIDVSVQNHTSSSGSSNHSTSSIQISTNDQDSLVQNTVNGGDATTN